MLPRPSLPPSPAMWYASGRFFFREVVLLAKAVLVGLVCLAYFRIRVFSPIGNKGVHLLGGKFAYERFCLIFGINLKRKNVCYV
ncbi:MAG: hypothetical protein LBC19_11360, partial [Tannerella sp.]|nr:hypothetical protein [Tannerella sp.]